MRAQRAPGTSNGKNRTWIKPENDTDHCLFMGSSDLRRKPEDMTNKLILKKHHTRLHSNKEIEFCELFYVHRIELFVFRVDLVKPCCAKK
jgi:hypothetical protein